MFASIIGGHDERRTNETDVSDVSVDNVCRETFLQWRLQRGGQGAMRPRPLKAHVPTLPLQKSQGWKMRF